jgi:hypothetical protein
MCLVAASESIVGGGRVVATAQRRKKATDAPPLRGAARQRVVVPDIAARPDNSKEVARAPKTDETSFSDTWRLTTQRPPRCSLCHHHVNPGSMEIMVDRKVWVFCGRRCRLLWRADHLPMLEAELPEPPRFTTSRFVPATTM